MYGPNKWMFLFGNLSQPKSIGNSSWMDLQALKCSLNVKLPQNTFFELTTRNNAQWNTNMGIFVVMIDGFWYPPLGFLASIFLYPPTSIELIDGRSTILFTQVVIIVLVNTIWGVPTTLIIVASSSELLLKVFPSKTPPIHDPICCRSS